MTDGDTSEERKEERTGTMSSRMQQRFTQDSTETSSTDSTSSTTQTMSTEETEATDSTDSTHSTTSQDANQSDTSETESTPSTPSTTSTTEIPSTAETTVRKTKGRTIFVGEETLDAVDLLYDELNLEWRREHGEKMPKNKAFYPAMIRTALQHEDTMREELSLHPDD